MATEDSLIRSMADCLCRHQIDLDDRSLCFMVLWERFGAPVRDCMDAARTMARIRLANEGRMRWTG